MALQKGTVNGVACVVDSGDTSTPVSNMTGDGGDIIAGCAALLANLGLGNSPPSITNLQLTTHLLASTDNTYDIGASGATRPRSIYAGTEVRAPAMWVGTGPWVQFSAPSTGVLTLIDNAGTGFNRIQFGGTTSSFPALKRNSTGIDVRLADDSGYAPLTASTITATSFVGSFSVGAPTELTIATGVITATKSYHKVDTEADAASDDLDTISGGSDGNTLILRAENTARTVVVKDGTGNIQCAGDCSLDNTQDTITLIFDGTLNAWLETARSNNGT